MIVTHVYAKLPDSSSGNLMGFCQVVFDNLLIVRDIKILNSGRGPFLAFPTRFLTDHCPNSECKGKNRLEARFCNWCGRPLQQNRFQLKPNGRPLIEESCTHPMNTDFRFYVQDEAMKALERERYLVNEPCYQTNYPCSPDERQLLEAASAVHP